jgi:hypothetical protein
MIRALLCLVDPDGNVFAKDGATSYEEVAEEFALDLGKCRRCRFDLTERRRILNCQWPESLLDAIGPQPNPVERRLLVGQSRNSLGALDASPQPKGNDYDS